MRPLALAIGVVIGLGWAVALLHGRLRADVFANARAAPRARMVAVQIDPAVIRTSDPAYGVASYRDAAARRSSPTATASSCAFAMRSTARRSPGRVQPDDQAAAEGRGREPGAAAPAAGAAAAGAAAPPVPPPPAEQAVQSASPSAAQPVSAQMSACAARQS